MCWRFERDAFFCRASRERSPLKGPTVSLSQTPNPSPSSLFSLSLSLSASESSPRARRRRAAASACVRVLWLFQTCVLFPKRGPRFPTLVRQCCPKAISLFGTKAHTSLCPECSCVRPSPKANFGAQTLSLSLSQSRGKVGLSFSSKVCSKARTRASVLANSKPRLFFLLEKKKCSGIRALF